MALDPDDRTLYIGNLDKNVTEEILYELFLQAGPIERVTIPCNNGNSYRYGFVTYKHDCSIEYAIDLYKGTNLFKKELIIQKRSVRNSGNGQQKGDSNNHSTSDKNSQNIVDIKEQLQILQQNFLLNYNAPALFDITQKPVKRNWSKSNWNKPYNYGPRNHTPRIRESRERHYPYHGKSHYGKNRRRRD